MADEQRPLTPQQEFEQRLGPVALRYLLALPRHMQVPVAEYAVYGHPVGDFLFALLSNDFVEAAGRADSVNQQSLIQWASFLYNAMPSYPVPSWGSADAVKNWQKIGGLRGGKVGRPVDVPDPDTPNRSRTKWYCAKCEDLIEHEHWHDTAHGIPETHMVGTERYKCRECGLVTFASDEGANHFIFKFDKAPGSE